MLTIACASLATTLRFARCAMCVADALSLFLGAGRGCFALALSSLCLCLLSGPFGFFFLPLSLQDGILLRFRGLNAEILHTVYYGLCVTTPWTPPPPPSGTARHGTAQQGAAQAVYAPPPKPHPPKTLPRIGPKNRPK